MKNLTAIGFFLLLILISCTEYSSEYPLSTVESSYSKSEIYGAWNFVWNSENDDPHKLVIYKYNEKEYLVLFIPEEPTDSEEVIALKSHLTKIGENEYANTRLISDGNSDEAEYTVHKLNVDGDKLILSSMPAKLVESLGIEFKSMQDHHNFVSKNADNLPYWTVRYEYKRLAE
jgi:hypothetical protein